jgi:hypothetical protein
VFIGITGIVVTESETVTAIQADPLSSVPLKYDSSLFQGANYVGSGDDLPEPAKHLDSLPVLVVQAQMEVNMA